MATEKYLTVSFHHSSNKSCDLSSENGRIQWRLKYLSRVLESTNEHLCLTIVHGALSADVFYCIDVVTYSRSNSEQRSKYSGKTCVKLGNYANLQALYKKNDGYSREKTVLQLCILNIVPIVGVPVESTLSSGLVSTLDTEMGLGDVTLYFGEENEPFQVLRSVLIARSPVFRRMLLSDFKEGKHLKIEIPDISSDVGQELVRYMYTDSAPNIVSMPEELWLAADKYELNGLKALCENELGIQLTPDNAAHTLLFADQCCGDGPLKKYILTFITRDKETCSQVMRSEEWKEVRKLPDLALAVSERYFGVPSEPPPKRLHLEDLDEQ